MIIVTDTPMLASRDFPNDWVLYRFEDVLELPDGSEIAIVEYSRPPTFMGHAGVSAAKAFIARGTFVEAEAERPLG